MAYIIHTITLGLFLLPCFLMGAEKQPSEEQKRQWAADAKRYEQIVAALGGKMAEQKNKPKITDTPLTKTDIRAKL